MFYPTQAIEKTYRIKILLGHIYFNLFFSSNPNMHGIKTEILLTHNYSNLFLPMNS